MQLTSSIQALFLWGHPKQETTLISDPSYHFLHLFPDVSSTLQTFLFTHLSLLLKTFHGYKKICYLSFIAVYTISFPHKCQNKLLWAISYPLKYMKHFITLKMSLSFQQASSIPLKVSNISIKNCLMFLSKKVLCKKKINKTSRFFKRMNLLKRTQWLLTTDRRIKKIISKQPIFPQNVSICPIIRDHALSWPRSEFWGNTDWRRIPPSQFWAVLARVCIWGNLRKGEEGDQATSN